MGNCCYVAVCVAVEGASAPTGEKRGGELVILLFLPCITSCNCVVDLVVCCVDVVVRVDDRGSSTGSSSASA